MARAKFIGVYATARQSSAQTKSGEDDTAHWFAWEDGLGRHYVQRLDNKFQAIGELETVSPEDFKTHFQYRPRLLATPRVHPEISASQTGEERLAWTSEKRRVELDEEIFSAEAFQRERRPRENEFVQRDESDQDLSPEEADERASKLDREMRAEFDNALSLWKKGDKVRPLKVFENLCDREQGIIPAHKHAFTDFAILLRKSRLPALATRHYQKVVKLAPGDGHAHFNLARIYYETDRLNLAEEELQIALQLLPDLDYASRFLKYIQEIVAPGKGGHGKREKVAMKDKRTSSSSGAARR